MSFAGERARVVTVGDHLPTPVTGICGYLLAGSQVWRQSCRRVAREPRSWATCQKCRLSPSERPTGGSPRRLQHLASTRARTTSTRTSRRAARSRKLGAADGGRREDDLRSSLRKRARREPASARQHRRLPPDGEAAWRPLHRRAVRLPVLWRERPEPPFAQLSLEPPTLTVRLRRPGARCSSRRR